jgi:hypothetical protein
MGIKTFAVILLFAPASIVWGADTAMSEQERAHVLKLLEDSRVEFLSYVENVSEAQWTWKAAPDRWSVGETAEHIVLAEGGLFSRMKVALDAAPNPDWEKQTAGKTEFIETVMVDRSHKAVAPEQIRPQGLSKDEVIRRYKDARAKTIAFARDTQIPLKERTSEHPFPVFNTLNAYQWLLYIPLHNLRHDQQIAEVKASPGYPK